VATILVEMMGETAVARWLSGGVSSWERLSVVLVHLNMFLVGNFSKTDSLISYIVWVVKTPINLLELFALDSEQKL